MFLSADGRVLAGARFSEKKSLTEIPVAPLPSRDYHVLMDSFPTILLIDPHDEDRQYWAERLKVSRPDCTVIEASNGAQGLAICRMQRIDCVVVELVLPDMSVFELLIKLVPRVSHPEIAVIVLSRLAVAPIADLTTSNGAHAFLVKSLISGDDLDRIVSKALAAIGPHKERPFST
jgi:DNA-binding NarL/FixJ family response regulator